MAMRAAAWTVLIAGASGSAALVLYTGRRNPSLLLVAMFVLWVLAPFAGVAWASLRWPALRTTLDVEMIAVSACSLAVYGAVAFGPPRSQPASFFLLTPPALALLGALAIAAATRRRR